jgi:type VI secretion system protein ImpK
MWRETSRNWSWSFGRFASLEQAHRMASTTNAPDDPFGNFAGHGTFIRPKPAGWTSPPANGDALHDLAALQETAPADHGLNPLLAVANRLLLLAPHLARTRHVADLDALRASLAQGVREFEAAAKELGIAPERVMAARYVLCTLLDEAASTTPWGGAGAWGRHNLLAEFHNEGSGGEKVFQLMARLAEKPEANLDLLQLIYAALAVGFEGRYRTMEGGRTQLDAVRARLGQIIRQQTGPHPTALADHWAAPAVAPRRVLSWLPLAASAAVLLLLLGAAYVALSKSLADRADPVYAQIQRLRLPPPVAAVAQPAPQPRLAQFLEADVRAGLVSVRDEVDRSVVTVRGDGLFARGSATLLPEREALMRRIADALVRVGGDVLVTGHTDNTPMRTARFPSNWHLSEERAGHVRDLMAKAGVPLARLRAQGLADGEPVQPNNSEPNRALNRRVEITLFAQRPEAAERRAESPAPAAPAASR